MSASASGPLKGTLTVPGDKSVSHRALIFGALSTVKTTITGLLEAQDVLNTGRALQALGVPVEKVGDTWEVLGRGVGGLKQPETALDFGNSGTGARLMMGVIAGHPITVEVVGDASLSRRPMGRVLTPLRQVGLAAAATNGAQSDTLPLMLTGLSDPLPIVYELPVPSAQVKSAVLLAGLHAAGQTTVIEREPTRDHTERMLKFFGANIETVPKPEDGTTHIVLIGQPELTGRALTVPADPSSAAFPAAAAAIVPDSNVKITNVLINETRIGFYKTLSEMGASVSFEKKREEAGEPVADIVVTGAPLKGVTVPPERAPTMIDEYPILSVVAAYAEGITRMEGLAELKVKESDRLSATARGLTANGVDATVEGDCLVVNGGTGQVRGGGTVETHLDHRIAMAFLTLGLNAQDPVTVDDTAMIATSFPQFTSLMESLGAKFTDK